MLRQLLFAALLGLALSAPCNKISSHLQQVLNSNGVASVAVSFNADTNAVLNRVNSMRFATRGAKISTIMAQLEDLRATTQKNALDILNTHGVRYDSFWVNNKLFIGAADLKIVQAIATLPEVAEVREEKVLSIEEPIFTNNTINVNWNVEKIEAPGAWNLPGGNKGQGVVVATIDTGVRATHAALRNNFRSSFGWYDPYTRTSEPDDRSGHGSHIMGTIVGTNGIGVAPGAQWIACRGCSTSSCVESALVACGQFIVCPTLPNGQSPDCSQAPNVVSNSWEGGQGSTFYNEVIATWRAANIVPVFSQGNSGPSCGTVNSPADHPNVIAVGCTNSADAICSYSSRGPTASGAVKPDVVGTNMAGTHVAGTVALLLAHNPNLTYYQVKNLLHFNADRTLGSAATCGGTPPTAVPNNIYGYGRINARKSLAAAINCCYSTRG